MKKGSLLLDGAGGLFKGFLEPSGVEAAVLNDLFDPLGDLLPDLADASVVLLRSWDLGELNGDLLVPIGDLLWDLGGVDTGDWLLDRPIDFKDMFGEWLPDLRIGDLIS